MESPNCKRCGVTLTDPKLAPVATERRHLESYGYDRAGNVRDRQLYRVCLDCETAIREAILHRPVEVAG